MESKKRKALSDANHLEIRKRNRTHPPAQQEIARLPPLSIDEERIPLAEFINQDNETIQEEDSDIFKLGVEYYSIIEEDVTWASLKV